MKDFAKSIRTMNSNKEEIIKKKKEQGATLKVDNGQKLEFSDGTTYVKTSFSEDYREAHNHVGNEDNSDIIRAAKKQLEDAKKFGWAETGYNGWTKKDVEDLEKKIKELEQKQRTGNYSVTAETAASTMTREEFDAAIKAFKEELERAKREGRKDSVKLYEDGLKRAIELKKKYIGNQKVGNSVPDNLHERFGYRLAVTKDGEGKKETISELEMAISDYKSEISEKEKELSKDKQNLQKLEAVLRKYK